MFSGDTTSSRISLLTRWQTIRGKKENRACIRSTAATASFLRILNGPGEFCNKIISVKKSAKMIIKGDGGYGSSIVKHLSFFD